jgi:hypothetical protein
MTGEELQALIQARRKQLGFTRTWAAQRGGVSAYTARHWDDGEGLEVHAHFLNYLEGLGIVLSRVAVTADGQLASEDVP